MKRISLLMGSVLLLVLTCSLSHAQQGNIWYFGEYAGLDFNSGSPVVLTNGSLSTDEGCASICDVSGNILFYTDGSKVYDNVGNVDITGLPGNSSSTQSAVIVPKPGSSNNYFIFTMDRQFNGGSNNGMNYREVSVSGSTVSSVGSDVSLQGYAQCTEKIAASCHANGTDYWVTTLRRNGDFASWLVSSSGVAASPIISSGMAIPTSQPASSSDNDRVGAMKINNQGTKLAVARRANSSQNELFDFDNSTGQVTSNQGVYYTGVLYGVEFSANGDYFYVSTFDKVYMFDMGLSSTLLHTSNGTQSDRVGALQMGPDGEIYVANGYENNDGDHLDKISSVENGTPVYHDDFISLPIGHKSRLGLPDIVSCFVPVSQGQECQVEAKFDLEQEECSFSFANTSTAFVGTNVVSWEWTFGDGYSSTEENPTHVYAQSGNFEVCLTVTAFNGKECCVSTYCQDVSIDRTCGDEPCDIEHAFNWSIIEDCVLKVEGIVNSTNRNIIAWMYDFGDGTSGSGQNTTHSYNTNGTYVVCLTVIGSVSTGSDGQAECCVFTYCEEVTIDCAGDDSDDFADGRVETVGSNITSAEDNSSFKVYPNPTAGNISMELNIPISQKMQIRIIDYTGKVHWQNEGVLATKGMWKHTMDVDLPSGIYLLMIEGDGFTEVKKVRFIE